jgi:hypothetical protein
MLKRALDLVGKDNFIVSNDQGKVEYTLASLYTQKILKQGHINFVSFSKKEKTLTVDTATGEGLLEFEVNGKVVYGLLMPTQVYFDKNNMTQQGSSTDKTGTAGSQGIATALTLSNRFVEKHIFESEDAIIEKLFKHGYSVVRGDVVPSKEAKLGLRGIKAEYLNSAQKASMKSQGWFLAGKTADVDINKASSFSTDKQIFDGTRFVELVEDANGTRTLIKKDKFLFTSNPIGNVLGFEAAMQIAEFVTSLGGRSYEIKGEAGDAISLDATAVALAELEGFEYLLDLDKEEMIEEVNSIVSEAVAALEGIDAISLGVTYLRVTSGEKKIGKTLPKQLVNAMKIVNFASHLKISGAKGVRAKLAVIADNCFDINEAIKILGVKGNAKKLVVSACEGYADMVTENAVSVYSKQAKNVFCKTWNTEYLGVITGNIPQGTVKMHPKHAEALGAFAMGIRYPLTGLIGLGVRIEYDYLVPMNMVVVNKIDLASVMGDTDGDMMTFVKISNEDRKELQSLIPDVRDIFDTNAKAKKVLEGQEIDLRVIPTMERLKDSKDQIRVNYDCTGQYTAVITKLAHVASLVLSKTDYRSLQLEISKQFCQVTIAAKNSKHFTADITLMLEELLGQFKTKLAGFTDILAMGLGVDPADLKEEVKTSVPSFIKKR